MNPESLAGIGTPGSMRSSGDSSVIRFFRPVVGFSLNGTLPFLRQSNNPKDQLGPGPMEGFVGTYIFRRGVYGPSK